jgi:Zn-dependent alcohol dehydrogenase
MYGSDPTKVRRNDGWAKAWTAVFEAVGLLNKGSKDAPAAPTADEASEVTAIGSNALNVTRVGGLAAVVTTVGAAAMALFNTTNEPTAVVVAAYGGCALVIAAALLTAAIIIAADIRARKDIAVTTPTAVPSPTVKVVEGSQAGTVSLDRAYEEVLIDATDGDVDLVLPKAATSAMQMIEVVRIDHVPGRVVFVEPVENGNQRHPMLANDHVRLYADGQNWKVLS